jgi:predicted acetyltransferase
MDLTPDQFLTETETINIRGEAWSPNGFPAGQCTWYADGRYKEWSGGWQLKFSRKSNGEGNAYKWWDNVIGFTKGKNTANVVQGQEGHVGDIMVINKWKQRNGTWSVGHVAFVEKMLTKSRKWEITHANWSSDKYTGRKIEGYKIYQATVKKSGNNVVIGGSSVPLRGFLYRK